MEKSSTERMKSGNLLCVVLAVLFALESLAVAMYGWPRFAVGEESGDKIEQKMVYPSKGNGQITCTGSSTFESGIASYSYTLQGKNAANKDLGQHLC